MYYQAGWYNPNDDVLKLNRSSALTDKDHLAHSLHRTQETL